MRVVLRIGVRLLLHRRIRVELELGCEVCDRVELEEIDAFICV